ncbi:hypothetical protein NC653_010518 [Populus alba x Populus x berolinensis]|uniref:Uncharacterized protein n=1 Tax=Populus alba x Populus x berolinensis TaxID=444605 RepID=A0AAD6R004_9ROSI|nr:hypothetical protein NC653_010518 [Populus alba x Populus x berolinensis]
MRELTVDVEEMKAAIKKISDKVAEFLRKTRGLLQLGLRKIKIWLSLTRN